MHSQEHRLRTPKGNPCQRPPADVVINLHRLGAETRERLVLFDHQALKKQKSGRTSANNFFPLPF